MLPCGVYSLTLRLVMQETVLHALNNMTNACWEAHPLIIKEKAHTGTLVPCLLARTLVKYCYQALKAVFAYIDAHECISLLWHKFHDVLETSTNVLDALCIPKRIGNFATIPFFWSSTALIEQVALARSDIHRYLWNSPSTH